MHLLAWIVLVLGNLLWPYKFIISKDEHKGKKEQKNLGRNEMETEKEVLNSKEDLSCWHLEMSH